MVVYKQDTFLHSLTCYRYLALSPCLSQNLQHMSANIGQHTHVQGVHVQTFRSILEKPNDISTELRTYSGNTEVHVLL